MSIDLERDRVARATLAYLITLLPDRAEELHALVTFFGPVEALDLLTLPDFPRQDRERYLGDMTIEQLHAHSRAVGEATRQAGARVLTPEDDDWPERLDDLSRVAYAAAPSSTLCLWALGNPGRIPARTVAICGSTAATPYGAAIASDLGQGMATAGWTVGTTSSFGIPAAVMRGTLAVGGRAVVVLPGGIDRPHPASLQGRLSQVTRDGLLVTAYPPGTEPSRERAVAAGRLLAGMTSGTVLVEAGLRSSSIAVIEEAIRRGRRAMIVPGPVTSALSAGTHQALRDHPQARLVRDSADILAELPQLR
ncbi:DNA-protecting protein DprA [Actinoplanes sp. NBC_00393]|uniref:DNA-processing protein DprA n=1 Tax=Actinoplanes sp. NBC_00393 TaxID=2975953 RepID=UPI002E1FC923